MEERAKRGDDQLEATIELERSHVRLTGADARAFFWLELFGFCGQAGEHARVGVEGSDRDACTGDLERDAPGASTQLQHWFAGAHSQVTVPTGVATQLARSDEVVNLRIVGCAHVSARW